MLIDVSNCKKALENAVQAELKSKSLIEILGFRVVKGPWDNTFLLDIDTEKCSLSALLLKVKGNEVLQMAGPFKVIKKEEKK